MFWIELRWKDGREMSFISEAMQGEGADGLIHNICFMGCQLWMQNFRARTKPGVLVTSVAAIRSHVQGNSEKEVQMDLQFQRVRGHDGRLKALWQEQLKAHNPCKQEVSGGAHWEWHQSFKTSKSVPGHFLFQQDHISWSCTNNSAKWSRRLSIQTYDSMGAILTEIIHTWWIRS